MDNCFLSLAEDQPLAIWWANNSDSGVIPLNDFLEESKIDMSKVQAARYAIKLQKFVDELEEFSVPDTIDDDCECADLGSTCPTCDSYA